MTRCPPNVKCRGVVPAVSHIMLHSDTLANEFNDILNAVEIFAPFQPLDPAVSFYAPLQFNTRDLRLSQDTFRRNSEAWYLDGSGIYRRSLSHQARFGNNRLLMEPAKTNKCISYNANPDAALSNWILTGAAGAVIRRVQDSELVAVGLGNVCSSGDVVECDNRANAVGDWATFRDAAPANNTNVHTISAWCKKLDGDGGDTKLRTHDNSFSIDFDNSTFERITVTGNTTTGSGLALRVNGGARCRVILYQYEESPVVTSPIITEGTAGQRSIDNLLYQRPTFLDLFNQSEGVVVADFQPLWNDDDINDQPYIPLLGVNTGSNLLYALHIAGTSGIRFYSFDQVNAPQVRYIGGPVNGELFRVVSHWSAADPNELGIGVYRYSDEQWTWDNRAYNGSFPTNESFYVGNEPALPHRVSGAQVFNQYRDRQWIEDNLTP